jgi:hypothetical protein
MYLSQRNLQLSVQGRSTHCSVCLEFRLFNIYLSYIIEMAGRPSEVELCPPLPAPGLGLSLTRV